MHVAVNRRTCVRSGQCSYLHPELMGRDEQDYPAPRPIDPTTVDRAAIDDMIDLCPTSSLALSEDDDR